MRPRVVVAEDHEVSQYIIRRILETGYDIVAVVNDGESALEAVRNYHPDIVLLDIAMPKMNGIAAAKCLKKEHPEVKILFVSAHPEKVYVEEAFNSGADGYVFKASLQRELVNAVEKILAGGVYSPI